MPIVAKLTTAAPSICRMRLGMAIIGTVWSLSSFSTPPSKPDITAATKGMVRREDLEIVDCLLPGQVRQLGNVTYVTQRRPTHTTAADCRIRGGEYVAYDRADLKSALGVWLPAAQAGDAEAETNVAEIYERGLGVPPNYTEAVAWYQKAADQKYSRALFNLGTLYEQGLGVAQDKLKALNLYRQAWGLKEDSFIYQSAAYEQQEALRTELQKQVAERDEQLELLQQQMNALQKELAKQAEQPAVNAKAQAEIEALKKWIAQLESERNAGQAKLGSLTQFRKPSDEAPHAPIDSQAIVRSVDGLNFGRYYALIIGNQHYQHIESLQTPLNDAERTASLLRDKYGFTVQVLEDSSDVAMLKALNDLNDVLKPEDNLLIYYAGHGARLKTAFNEAGYWLPINSEAPPNDTFWVANEQITAHLARLQAKRILVVADSCYAGLLSTDPSYVLAGGTGGYTKEFIAYQLPKRARLLISSGGDEPVLDTGGGGNSVFAHAFIGELEANQGILATPELFSRISKRVAMGAAENTFNQKPEFKAIKGAGHEVGDFFFVPKDLKGKAG